MTYTPFRPQASILWKVFVCGTGILCLLWMGCSRLQIPEDRSPLHPLEQGWHDEILREHLRFFNSPEIIHRPTGSVGFVLAADYVAARMAEFGLQPLTRRRFQVSYSTLVHTILGSSLSLSGVDTLTFVPGLDYLPDGRSDSGTAEVDAVLIDPSQTAGFSKLAVMIPSEKATTAYLQSLRDEGLEVVLVVGPLRPVPATQPIADLLIFQLSPRAATSLLGIDVVRQFAEQTSFRSSPRILPRRVLFSVAAETTALAEGLNVLGMVPGKHPRQSRRLILVGADLDVTGQFAGLPTLDTAHLGTEAAALLELARQYSLWGSYGTTPEQTLLFAVFSGTQEGHLGFKNYLEHPAWPLSHTTAIYYLSHDTTATRDLRTLARPYGVPFHSLTLPPDSLLPPRLTITPPQPSLPRPFEVATTTEEPPDKDDLILSAIAQARQLADSTHRLLLPRIITSASFITVGDSLPPPKELP